MQVRKYLNVVPVLIIGAMGGPLDTVFDHLDRALLALVVPIGSIGVHAPSPPLSRLARGHGGFWREPCR